MIFKTTILVPFLWATSTAAAANNYGTRELQDILQQAQDLRASSKASLRGGNDVRDSLADLLASLDKHTNDLPDDLKFAVDETNDLVRGGLASDTNEMPLVSDNNTEEAPTATSSRRKLQKQKNTKAGTDAKSIAVDAFGHFQSIPGMSKHLQLHDAIVSGDLSFAKSKVKSLGRKLNRPRAQDRHRRRNQESSQKSEQCQELVECASDMTVYDLL